MTAEVRVDLEIPFTDDTLTGAIKKIHYRFGGFTSSLLQIVPDFPQRAAALQKLAEVQELCEYACFEQVRRSVR